MKIALFSDIHGNDLALEAILADADRQRVDLIVCAGDVVNPFPGSRRAWERVWALEIPLVRGNHEEYMLAMQQPAEDGPQPNMVQFLPAQVAAETLSAAILADMAALPMTISLAGPGGDDVLLCHASPHHTRHSFAQRRDEAMAASLNRYPQRVVAAGHIHEQWSMDWQGKRLLLCGGGGLPLNGCIEAQYLILTHRRGRWRPEHRTVPYDHQAMMAQLEQTDFLNRGGPIAWLFYEELLLAQKRIVPFLNFIGPAHGLVSLADWQQAARRYLQSIGRWAVLAPLVELVDEP